MTLRLDTWYRAVALAIGMAVARPAWAAGQRADTVDASAADTAHPTAAMVAHASDSGISLGPRLSLAAVIARTALYSPTLDSASGVVRTSRSAERVALGAYLPSVAANGLAGRSDQGVASTTTVTTGPQGAYGGGVSATLALFTGGRRGAVRHQAAAAARAADVGVHFPTLRDPAPRNDGLFRGAQGP